MAQQATLKLKELRTEAGWSQQILAQKARCSISSVRNVEGGITPGPKLAGSLERALGLNRGTIWPVP